MLRYISKYDVCQNVTEIALKLLLFFFVCFFFFFFFSKIKHHGITKNTKPLIINKDVTFLIALFKKHNTYKNSFFINYL